MDVTSEIKTPVVKSNCYGLQNYSRAVGFKYLLVKTFYNSMFSLAG